jgi:lipopolysaccharide/colanic/teichoic acid biosynthesis glycosyltransferase
MSDVSESSKHRRPVASTSVARTSSFAAREGKNVVLGQTTILLQSGLPLTLDSEFKPARLVAPPKWKLAIKRVADIVIATTALLLLSLVFVAITALIRLTSPGPAMFRQARVGLNGRPFMMLKFRTMHLNESDASGVKQTTYNDERVTRLGRVLRRSSLDELPQLVNVLLGDMSVVGPRPHVAGMQAGGMAYEELVPDYNLRTLVLPGLTGWAQANGLRGSTHDAEVARARINHDFAYIENYSFWLDARIIFMTITGQFLTGTGS